MDTIFDADPFDTSNAFKHAGIGILFSVNDANVKLSKAEIILIDTFFETLAWSNPSTDPVDVNLITFGDLMTMADHKSRWIYKGSLTTPPCTR